MRIPALLFAAAICGQSVGGAFSPEHPHRLRQSADDAIAEDLRLIAEARGWTLQEATAQMAAADAIGKVAERLARERRNAFVGTALATAPGDPPTLYIKGEADALVRSLIGSAGIKVIVRDHQPYSFDELETRKLRVHEALRSLGFSYVATAVNISGGGVIPAAVTMEPGLPTTPDELLESLPIDLRSFVKLTVRTGPLAMDYQAFGGMWVRTGTNPVCTSGWSVRRDSDGLTGVTTAGHCVAIDHIVHPGHATHALTFRGQHTGQWGDIEWHSSSELEPDDFYSDAATVRNVISIEPRAAISEGEPICVYGRFTDDRDCSLVVEDVSQACTNNNDFNDRLVMMDGVTSAVGDSGGGWSFGATAYGSVKGICSPDHLDREVWSVADLFDEALGVRVRIG
jgi:hypothetical protein